MKTLWLSNMLRILHNLKQYSGEKPFQTESTQKQMDQCLRNFDLSEYRRVISDIAVWIYQVRKTSMSFILFVCLQNKSWDIFQPNFYNFRA